MAVYRLDLAYHGSGFHGYARQRQVRTVQGDLETALEPFVGEVETVVAGRTDKGVHASGQVVSFATTVPVDVDRVRRSLNRRLGPEIAVLGLDVVADDFHARFSAKGRAYTYLVIDGETPDPFLATSAWHYRHALDVELMNRGAGHLVGDHDFASFCRAAEGRSTVRQVREAIWTRRRPDMVAFDIEASSFCHQMVRSVVALLVEVGRGKVDPDQIPAILAARDRGLTKGVAPPHGLTLVRVDYE